MGRLIDADKLILHLNDYALQEATLLNGKVVGKYDTIQECIKVTEEQPTAFDVEKVIEQLNELLEEKTSDGGEDWYTAECLGSAIEIVKRGGRDEE